MAFNAIIPNDPVEIKTAYRPTISMKKELTILLLGSGGREHALAWKIAQSAKCGKLYIAPGNAGTSSVGENVPIGVNDFEALKTFAADHAVDMVVVGPEDPLAPPLQGGLGWVCPFPHRLPRRSPRSDLLRFSLVSLAGFGSLFRRFASPFGRCLLRRTATI